MITPDFSDIDTNAFIYLLAHLFNINWLGASCPVAVLLGAGETVVRPHCPHPPAWVSQSDGVNQLTGSMSQPCKWLHAKVQNIQTFLSRSFTESWVTTTTTTTIPTIAGHSHTLSMAGFNLLLPSTLSSCFLYYKPVVDMSVLTHLVFSTKVYPRQNVFIANKLSHTQGLNKNSVNCAEITLALPLWPKEWLQVSGSWNHPDHQSKLQYDKEVSKQGQRSNF